MGRFAGYITPPWEGGSRPITVQTSDGSSLQLAEGPGITIEVVNGVATISITSLIPPPGDTFEDGVSWDAGFVEAWDAGFYTSWV